MNPSKDTLLFLSKVSELRDLLVMQLNKKEDKKAAKNLAQLLIDFTNFSAITAQDGKANLRNIIYGYLALDRAFTDKLPELVRPLLTFQANPSQKSEETIEAISEEFKNIIEHAAFKSGKHSELELLLTTFVLTQNIRCMLGLALPTAPLNNAQQEANLKKVQGMSLEGLVKMAELVSDQLIDNIFTQLHFEQLPYLTQICGIKYEGETKSGCAKNIRIRLIDEHREIASVERCTSEDAYVKLIINQTENSGYQVEDVKKYKEEYVSSQGLSPDFLLQLWLMLSNEEMVKLFPKQVHLYEMWAAKGTEWRQEMLKEAIHSSKNAIENLSPRNEEGQVVNVEGYEDLLSPASQAIKKDLFSKAIAASQQAPEATASSNASVSLRNIATNKDSLISFETVQTPKSPSPGSKALQFIEAFVPKKADKVVEATSARPPLRKVESYSLKVPAINGNGHNHKVSKSFAGNIQVPEAEAPAVKAPASVADDIFGPAMTSGAKHARTLTAEEALAEITAESEKAAKEKARIDDERNNGKLQPAWVAELKLQEEAKARAAREAEKNAKRMRASEEARKSEQLKQDKAAELEKAQSSHHRGVSSIDALLGLESVDLDGPANPSPTAEEIVFGTMKQQDKANKTPAHAPRHNKHDSLTSVSSASSDRSFPGAFFPSVSGTPQLARVIAPVNVAAGGQLFTQADDAKAGKRVSFEDDVAQSQQRSQQDESDWNPFASPKSKS